MTGAAQDDACVVALVADGMTWQDIARQAIHQLAAAHAEHEALQARYDHLLAEHRAVLARGRGRAA